MRIPLFNLLARSPLPRIEEMMKEVVACSDQLPELIEHLINQDFPAVNKTAKSISDAEGRADDAKDAVRSRMPTRLFLQVDRRDVLKLVSQIDAIADCAEDVGVLLTLRPLPVPDDLTPVLRQLVEKVMQTVHEAAALVSMTDELVESGFSGVAAETALKQTRTLSRYEHEADKLQDRCAKLLFAAEHSMPPVAVFMWTKVLNKIGDVANHAENVGDQYRLFVAA